jgi:hypothetical protein
MTERQKAETEKARQQAEAIFRRSRRAEMATIGLITFRRGKNGTAVLAGRRLPDEGREDFHADI